MRTLIVEDELIERKSLHFLIQELFPNKLKIIGEARDGEEAVEKAHELKPDLILMDIQMPRMDGLQASNQIKKIAPESEIIILTAFSYFEYAKKAIQIGVNDFLVKPYSNDDFEQAIHKVIDKINERRGEEKDVENLKRKVESASVFMEREMVKQLIHTRNLPRKTMDEYIDVLGIKEAPFYCVILRNISEKQLFNEQHFGLVISEYKQKDIFILGKYFLNEIVLLVFVNEQNKVETYDEVSETIKESLNDAAKLDVIVGQSMVYNDLTKANEAYYAAKNTSKQSKRSPIGSLYTQIASLYEQENQLVEAIKNRDEVLAHKTMTSLWMKVAESENIEICRLYTQQLYFLFQRQVSQFFDRNYKVRKIEEMFEETEKMSHIDDIYEYTLQIISEIIDLIQEIRVNISTQMIDKVKGYLDNHYMDFSISLDQVSDYIGISPSYLSRSFRKVEGITFKDYLTKIRMEIAMNLLRDQREAVQDVAVKVGYLDPNYFSKAFRKYSGLSPREYMQTKK